MTSKLMSHNAVLMFLDSDLQLLPLMETLRSLFRTFSQPPSTCCQVKAGVPDDSVLPPFGQTGLKQCAQHDPLLQDCHLCPLVEPKVTVLVYSWTNMDVELISEVMT
ncbi:uncharacterized [Tachysurus ichikawai]